MRCGRSWAICFPIFICLFLSLSLSRCTTDDGTYSIASLVFTLVGLSGQGRKLSSFDTYRNLAVLLRMRHGREGVEVMGCLDVGDRVRLGEEDKGRACNWAAAQLCVPRRTRDEEALERKFFPITVVSLGLGHKVHRSRDGCVILFFLLSLLPCVPYRSRRERLDAQE